MTESKTRAMNDLDKEIAMMEKALTGAPEESTKEEEIKPTVRTETEPTEKVIATTPPLQEDYSKLQNRFNKYKGTTDQTIYSLREENRNLKSQMATLMGKVQELSKQNTPKAEEKSIDSYLSQEDKEILGDSAVSALDKSIKDLVQSKVSGLESQLENERKSRMELERKQIQKDNDARHQAFVSQLSRLVPDFQEIVGIPDFRHRYMKEPDEYSGIIREKLFNAAEEDGDVGRVASFFNEYKAIINSNTSKLEESVTPVGLQGTVSEPTEGKGKWNITPQFIDTFYREVAKGDKKYKGRKGKALANEIEAAIDDFIMNGGHHTF